MGFHVHAVASKHAAFRPAAFRWTIARAKRMGLDAMVLTEHFSRGRFLADVSPPLAVVPIGSRDGVTRTR
jgi:hypothetical protein